MDKGMISIDGEEFFVDEVVNYGSLPEIRTETLEFVVAESRERAGEAAREYWEKLAQDEPKEFTCIIGEKALVAWGLGQNYAPGCVGVNSLSEWLDLWLDNPEDYWGTWDGTELAVDDMAEDIVDELGFTPTVAYRL